MFITIETHDRFCSHEYFSAHIVKSVRSAREISRFETSISVLVMLTNIVNARRIASVRYDTSRRTLTNWRILSSLWMIHVGRWQPAAVHHSRVQRRGCISTRASTAETSSATLPIIHGVADRWSLPCNYRLGIRDKLGCICRIFTLLRRANYRNFLTRRQKYRKAKES